MKEITLAKAIKRIRKVEDVYVKYEGDYHILEIGGYSDLSFTFNANLHTVKMNIPITELIDYHYYIKE